MNAKTIHRTYPLNYNGPTPEGWTKIPCDALQDNTLSFTARGILTALMVDEPISMKDLHGDHRKISVSNALMELADSGYDELLEKLHKNPKDKSSSTLAREAMMSTGANKCEWCSGVCHRLINHHFPVSFANGGTSTVKICGTCHEDFHHFEKLNQRRAASVN